MPTNSRQVVNGVAYENMDKLARKYTGQLTGTEPITIEPMKYIKLDDLSVPVTRVDGVPQYTGDTQTGYGYGCGCGLQEREASMNRRWKFGRSWYICESC